MLNSGARVGETRFVAPVPAPAGLRSRSVRSAALPPDLFELSARKKYEDCGDPVGNMSHLDCMLKVEKETQ